MSYFDDECNLTGLHRRRAVRLLSRRDFLYSAAAQIGALALAQERASSQSELSFRLSRAEDLVEFVLSLQNIQVVEVGNFSKSLAMQPSGAGTARISIDLPPQHLQEQAVAEDQTGQFRLPKRGDLRAWFSQPTRIVLEWPQGLTRAPLSLESILKLLTQTRTIFPPPTRGKPFEASEIEVIRNLLITPVNRDLVRLRSVQGAGRNGVRPIWAIAIENSTGDELAIRPIWSRDLDIDGTCGVSEPDCPTCRTSLTPKDRCEIVDVFSGSAPTCGTAVAADPVRAQPLLLSSQGSFLSFHRWWEPPPGCGLQGWTHQATQGRDHFVEIVRKYYAYPDGIPLTLVQRHRRGRTRKRKVQPDSSCP
jgi:hypothetical protein